MLLQCIWDNFIWGHFNFPSIWTPENLVFFISVWLVCGVVNQYPATLTPTRHGKVYLTKPVTDPGICWKKNRNLTDAVISYR